MEGVILFADDKIHEYSFDNEKNSFAQSDENKLFKELVDSYPVLAVKSLDAAEKSLKTIGSFSAVILDWQFNEGKEILKESDDDTTALVQAASTKDDKTFDFLMNNEIYSLIYVYSTAAAEISEKFGERLQAKYPGRLFVHDKANIKDTTSEKNKILKDITAWKEKNENLSIPLLWSQSIVQSVQRIFNKLNAADPNWISELHKTAVKDGVNPEIEVINLFQNILSENVIQDDQLLKKITDVANAGAPLSNPENYADLIRILYYGQSKYNDPIMTGDIFKHPDSDEYAIIITPECDVRHIADNPSQNYFEVLVFSKEDYRKGNFKLKATIKANPIIAKAEEFKTCKFTTKQKIAISQELNKQIAVAEQNLQIESFTQTNPRIHLLPCFQFDSGDNSGIAVIDFRGGLRIILGGSLNLSNRVGKLNSPYIQELRQRFLSYKGRVGVPAYSKALKEWLLLNK